MNKTEILTIAVETGFMLHTGYGQGINKQMPVSDTATLLDFANRCIQAAVLAAQAEEREACAKVCDDKHDYMCSRAAAAIRVRGE